MNTPRKESNPNPNPNPGGSHRDKLIPGAGNTSLPVPDHVTIRSKRNRDSGCLTPVQVRLPPDDLAVLDTVVERTRKAGLSVSRASVMADLVHGLLGASDEGVGSTSVSIHIPRSPEYIRPLCALHHPDANMSEACRRRIRLGMEALEGLPSYEWVAGLTRALHAYDAAVRDEAKRDQGCSRRGGRPHTGVRVPAPQKRFLDKCAELMTPADGARPADVPDAFANAGCFYAGSMALLLVYGAHVLG